MSDESDQLKTPTRDDYLALVWQVQRLETSLARLAEIVQTLVAKYPEAKPQPEGKL